MADTLDQARQMFDDVPEGAVMIRAVTIGMFIGPDGEVMSLWHLHNEDSMLIDWVGLLEFTKQQIVYEALEGID